MFIFELNLTLTAADSQQIDKAYRLFVNLADGLYRQGHTLSRHVPIPELSGDLRMFLSAVTADALAPHFYKSSLSKTWQELLTLTRHGPVFTSLGQERVNQAKSCVCEGPSYILDGEYDVYSPVRCLSCGLFVPLYTLPETYNPQTETSFSGEGYDDVFLWRQAYESVMSLWFQGLCEEQMCEELSEVDSELSEQGLDLSRRLEFLTGSPVYYFLADLSEVEFSLTQARSRSCPECGARWWLEEPLLERYDFCCEPCRLVSQLPAGLRH